MRASLLPGREAQGTCSVCWGGVRGQAGKGHSTSEQEFSVGGRTQPCLGLVWGKGKEQRGELGWRRKSKDNLERWERGGGGGLEGGVKAAARSPPVVRAGPEQTPSPPPIQFPILTHIPQPTSPL